MAKKEPKEGTRVGALTGPKLLTIMFPEYRAGFVSAANGWLPYKTWKTGTTPRGLRCIINEQYIDLQGYEMDDLTFIPTGAMIQDPGFYTTDDTNTPIMEIYDIVSQERLNIDELAENIVLNSAPGMLGVNAVSTTVDYNQLTFAKYRLMMNTAEFNEVGDKTYLLARTQEFGSGQPVTVQKLWCYRFIRFLVSDDKIMNVPASRMVISGDVIKEKDLVYMQRLKRVYETQGKL